MNAANELDQAVEISEKWLETKPELQNQLDLFVCQLRRRQIFGSYNCAKRTLELVRSMIGHCRWNNTEELIEKLKAVARLLLAAQPMELGIGNIIRRMLYLIREEHATLLHAMQQSKAQAPTS
ncbi:unnamed protein product, partial [Heterosigma akashiwo]